MADKQRAHRYVRRRAAGNIPLNDKNKTRVFNVYTGDECRERKHRVYLVCV